MKKCQAKGGAAHCKDENCPERTQFLSSLSPTIQTSVVKKPNVTPRPVSFGSWTKKDTVLYKTISGSKLYGLAHADSDDDFIIVTPTAHTKRRLNAKQKIQGELDVVTLDFATFVTLAEKGVPQVLEAMFSHQSKSLFFEPYRNSFYNSSGEAVDRYLRTIKSMSLLAETKEFQGEEKQAIKYRRHVARLSLNLKELVHSGRFNPTLNDKELTTVKHIGSMDSENFFTSVQKLQPFELSWPKWLEEVQAKHSRR